MMEWLTRLTPRARARMAGVFEALEGTGSSNGQVFILGSLVVTGDAAATAHNILTNEALFRLGFLVSVAGVAFHLAWSLLMYQLLKPGNSTIAALAAFVVLICCAMQALTAFFYLAPLLVLRGGPALSGLPAAHTEAVACIVLRVD